MFPQYQRFRLAKMIEGIGRATENNIATSLALMLVYMVRKYAGEIVADSPVRASADAENALHMRLFRAQRNLYISGFALLLFLFVLPSACWDVLIDIFLIVSFKTASIIKRIMALLSRGAQLEAAAEAAMCQAENASKTAKSLLVSFI
uniref:Endoplasmic reticulum transmembrane protein n=1 Tax=Parascaris equorum TaxID=6256 RepID=A0A914R611_PAREQ